MIRIAVIDDEKEEQERLLGYYQRLREEVHEDLDIHTYLSGDEFLSVQEEPFDLICLDIDMDGLDGISTAKEIRKKDEQVIIIFVTNMAQMAIRGYEVQALDFVVKPVNYYSFAMKMTNAFRMLKNRKSRNIVLTTASGMQKISTDDLYYVEVNGHYLYYHTKDQTIRHTASVRCPSGMARRMCHASRCWGEAREKERFSRRFSAILSAPFSPRHLGREALVAPGVQAYVIQDKRPEKALHGPAVPLQQGGPAAQEYRGHGPHVQAALQDGGEQFPHILVHLGVDDGPDALVHAGRVAPQDAFDLGCGQ